MNKKHRKRKLKLWNIISFASIILLLISTIYLYNKNNLQDHNLKEIEIKLEEIKKQEQFIEKHKEDLETIKTLKQEILGQQHNLEELGKQIESFTEILINNQQKLDEIEL